MKNKIVAKLSSKAIHGGKIDAPSKEAKKTPLYAVTGVATGVQTGESQYGEWMAFKGNFAAVLLAPDGTMKNGADDEQLRSGKLFLPAVAENLLSPAVMDAEKGQGVQFGFVIGVERNDDAATGYEYYAEPLIEADVNDPLEQLAASAFGALEDKSGGKGKGK